MPSLSQVELAEKAGISVNFVSELERCRKWPRANTLAKTVGVLDVPISSMFFESAEGNAQTGDAVSQLSEELRRSVDETIRSVCQKYSYRPARKIASAPFSREKTQVQNSLKLILHKPSRETLLLNVRISPLN
jgi:transcriptional regulator with XRE-family HTH domain